MRRFARTRRLSIAAAVSLVLFIAIAALWGRSYTMCYSELHQRIHVQGQQIDFTTDVLRVCDGSLYFHHDVTQFPVPNINSNEEKLLLQSRANTYAFMRQPPWDGASWPGDPNTWHVPLWLPLLLLLIAPVCWLIARPVNATAFPVVTKQT
ncbi:MAG TPA: hypothetical protein VFW23_03845 [Tepidisphaeraceae bacterium]|nr:hypothetical protein [Tepidisphaeraceae bacterium]